MNCLSFKPCGCTGPSKMRKNTFLLISSTHSKKFLSNILKKKKKGRNQKTEKYRGELNSNLRTTWQCIPWVFFLPLIYPEPGNKEAYKPRNSNEHRQKPKNKTNANTQNGTQKTNKKRLLSLVKRIGKCCLASSNFLLFALTPAKHHGTHTSSIILVATKWGD